MKRLLFLILLCSSICYAQNRSDGVISVRSGQPASGARIAVCTQPATTSAPCSPLATLYTDSSLGTPCAGTLLPPNVPGSPCSNPMTADGLGNYHFYASPGVYTLMFYGSSTTTYIQPDFSLPIAGGPVTNANLPNPMNLTDTLSINVTSGLGLHITNSGTNIFAQFSSTSFPSSGLGFSFQVPGVPSILGNSGLGNSQFIFTSKDLRFIPFAGLTGGVFGVGPSGTEWQITTDTSKLTKYAAASTAGNGQPVIRAAVNQTIEVTGNSGTLTLYTPSSNSDMYRLVVYTVISTNVATSTIQWTVSYTDVTGARTTVGSSILGDTAGTHAGETFSFEVESGVAITLANATANSPKYKYYIRLEEL